jgi:hypothetical protein
MILSLKPEEREGAALRIEVKPIRPDLYPVKEEA